MVQSDPRITGSGQTRCDLEAMTPRRGSAAPLEQEPVVLPRRSSATPRVRRLQTLRQTSRAVRVDPPVGVWGCTHFFTDIIARIIVARTLRLTHARHLGEHELHIDGETSAACACKQTHLYALAGASGGGRRRAAAAGGRRRAAAGTPSHALRRRAPTCRVRRPPSTQAARAAACRPGGARRARLVSSK